MALTVGTNTYISLADARAWAATRLDATSLATGGSTDAQAEAALLQACQALEALVPAGWEGNKTVDTQALQFPRIGVLDPRSSGDVLIPSMTIPDDIKYAQCLEAVELLLRVQDTGYAAARADARRGVQSVKLGSDFQTTYSGAGEKKFGGALLSEEAWTLVRRYRRTTPVKTRL